MIFASGLKRALSFLGVEPTERRSAGLMTAHSFFMGCSTVFFETAASATFLARFPSSYLPWVYIAAAGVNTVTGTVYSTAQRRVSFSRLMKGTLWFLLAIVLSVRVGLAVSGLAWVAFAGLVSYRIVSSLTDLEYWAVASRIYDVRQAKRLFGLVGTGEVVARTAGAFSIPLLVKVGGVGNLMVLSAGGLLLSLLFVGAALRPVPGVHDLPSPPSVAIGQPARGPQTVREGLREILTSPYLTMVVGVATLATFGKYFVDFAFLEQMSSLSNREEELAAYLGVFNGATQTVSLLTRLFVSRPLLARFGIRVGVVILPVMHAICSALTIASGALGFGAVSVFWLMLANQGIYKSFKHPIDNASFKVLYQPLKPEQRLSAQIAVEIIFSPVVVGIAGGVMLLFTAGMRYDPARFSILLLLNFVAWAFLARAAGRGYAKKLLDMIRRRIEGDVALPFDDATTLTVLRTSLESPNPAVVCVALDLLEKADAPGLVDALRARVSDPSPAIRRHVFERLIVLRPEMLHELRSQIFSDLDPSVRSAAVRAVSLVSSATVDDVVPYLGDFDPLVRLAAVEVLFGIHGDAGPIAGREAVARFASSDLAADRVLGARLAGDHGVEQVVPPLLADDDCDVRRAALAAAGHLRSASLRPALIEHLLDPRFAQTAARALASEGDAVLPVLDAMFTPSADSRLLRRLVYVYRLVGGPAAVSVLSSHLQFPEVTVRGRVQAALDGLGFVAKGQDRGVILELLESEARETAWTLGALRDLPARSSLAPLRRALEDEVTGAGRRAFHLLAFVHDPVAVHRAAAHMAHPSKEKRAYAHEVVELMLDPEQRGAIMPLVDGAKPEDRLESLAERFPQAKRGVEECLRELAGRSDRWLGQWPRMLARRETGELKEDAMLLIEKVIILKTVPVFANTSEDLVAEIAGILKEIECAAGHTIFEKGDMGDSMYIVVAGKVRVSDGETTLSLLGEKEIFGELALLDPKPRSATVTAMETTRLFRLDGDTFSQLMAGNLDIVRGVLHVLCERLRRTSAAASRVD